jgi:competence protein ComEC
VHIHDNLQLRGQLKVPESFYTDTGRQFDYQKYLAAKKVGYIMSYPEVQNFGHEGQSLREVLINLKYKFLDVTNRHLSPAEAGLVGGVLLGDQSGLPEPLQNDFRRVGIIHIVVLSGYNVMLVADALRKSIGRINQPAGWGAALVGVLLFAVITGLQVTVVRATIMAIVLLIAQALRRPYMAVRGLLLAMLVMMWISPYIVIADLGFQLSVLATLGIIYGVPIVERWFRCLPEKFGIREIATVTIATQLTVLPLLMYSVGQVSLVSPIVNVLVILFVPLAMAVGAVMVVAGIVWAGLAVIISPIVYVIFHYIVWISELIGSWEFAAIEIPPLPGWVVAGLYLVLVIWIIRYERRQTNALAVTS